MLCCQRGDYMNKDNELLDLTTDNKSTIKKRKYSKPELICYGDVRDITLGATMPVLKVVVVVHAVMIHFALDRFCTEKFSFVLFRRYQCLESRGL